MTKYIAMINMPGYMPDMEPVSFKTKGECLDYLQQQIHREYEDAEGDENILKLELEKAINELNINGFTYYHNYYYGINKE